MGRLIKKKYSNVTLTSSGLELDNLIAKGYNRIDGYIKQIIFKQNSGSASELSLIEIRYLTGDSSYTNLVYKNTAAILEANQYADSYIEAPFSIDTLTDTNQLILYMQTDATGVFDIRVDIEITGS